LLIGGSVYIVITLTDAQIYNGCENDLCQYAVYMCACACVCLCLYVSVLYIFHTCNCSIRQWKKK